MCAVRPQQLLTRAPFPPLILRLKPLIETLDDLSCDVPRAPEFLAEIVALVRCALACVYTRGVAGAAVAVVVVGAGARPK